VSAVAKKLSRNPAVPQRYGLTHCLECDRKISANSNYSFFCSKDCAADWGDDEAQMQAVAIREKRKKANDFMKRSGISIEHKKEKATS